jgi:hypothetical protein
VIPPGSDSMRCLVALLTMAVMAIAAVAKGPGSPTDLPPVQVLLTLYSPHGSSMLELPGRKSWGGHLWIDHHKIGGIMPGQFLILKLPEGEHSLAGEQSSFLVRESNLQTPISLHAGERYFMRLIIESKAVAGLGPTRWIAEPVTCQEAYREAATLGPVKLKRIERSSLEQVARESYFPECGK